ncbi:hypothetical protein NPIL_630221 [Nephila pilipes]|uniref:Uncharacterized protein n=1 Tax=Nephila pilipes TaxID=299642 RepID=A0A8X6NLB2_NEPPI|nr:hypothetical protein NPIL_630221 [Nephila pilipes]
MGWRLLLGSSVVQRLENNLSSSDLLHKTRQPMFSMRFFRFGRLGISAQISGYSVVGMSRTDSLEEVTREGSDRYNQWVRTNPRVFLS